MKKKKAKRRRKWRSWRAEEATMKYANSIETTKKPIATMRKSKLENSKKAGVESLSWLREEMDIEIREEVADISADTEEREEILFEEEIREA